jgi:hypothetical protein
VCVCVCVCVCMHLWAGSLGEGVPIGELWLGNIKGTYGTGEEGREPALAELLLGVRHHV